MTVNHCDGSWHLSHKTVGRPTRAVWTKHVRASIGEEMDGGSHSCRGTKDIRELSRPQFISLAPGILAPVHPTDDGQEFDEY